MELFAPPLVETEALPGGGMLLHSPTPLGDYGRCVGEWLLRWARETPDRQFLAERGAGGTWRRVTYADALARTRSVGQALIDRKLSAERPVMILSENGIEHALLALGAMHVGVPVVPVSVAYSRMSQDFAKLRHIAGIVRPGLVYARDGAAFAKAIAALDCSGAEVVTGAAFDGMAETRATGAVDEAFAAVTPDTVAKILFTSGSTGQPKGVINTQRMLCSNQQQAAQAWPILEHEKPVIVDWLPWNHTFGANHNFNMVLRNGGELWIDEGKPAPGLVEKTVATLKEVSPTLYFNVPRGYSMLLDHLERDRSLAEKFFARMRFLFYAGAALPQSLWERLERIAEATRGERVPMISSWGLTETAPMAVTVHYPIERAGIVGLPAPGLTLKLVPVHGKLEMRVKGPNVTPGYWRDPEQTRACFDEEGFYRTGDAGRLADPADPVKGIVFDGRLGENFKLGSGTWVNVGELRVAVIAACAPVIEDCVVAGHDRDEVGILVFPSLAGCRSLCAHLPDGAPAQLVLERAVRETLAAGLAAHNRVAGGSSHRVACALLMSEPPSIDANEITDKGYINQRAVLDRRATLVERLFGDGQEVVRP